MNEYYLFVIKNDFMENKRKNKNKNKYYKKNYIYIYINLYLCRVIYNSIM